MRFARILLDDAPQYIAQRTPSEPWARIVGPLRADAELGAPVAAELVAAPLAAIDPRLLIGTANIRPEGDDPMTVFLKSPHTVAPADAPLLARTEAGIFAEAEIAAVIGRRMSQVPASEALDHVLGWTVANDATDQPEVAREPRMFRAKNGTGYTPAGAFIDTDFDPAGAEIAIAVDGATVATATAEDLLVPIAEQLAYLSTWTVLEPGDVVMTGCPGTGAVVLPGQTVEVSVAGLGAVRSTVTLGP